VATEMGMLYRLRKDIPQKIFHPVSVEAVCEYMKMNTLEKLLDSLKHDRIEVTVEGDVKDKAQMAIQRMLTIQ
jgi:quinolinate synthase